MSVLGKIGAALTRQGTDHPIDVALQIYLFGYIVAALLAFVIVMGVIAGAVQ